MEKRASIVRACLLVYGILMSLLCFASFWAYASRPLWTSYVEGGVALVSLAMGLGLAFRHRPHYLVSGAIAISALLAVVSALCFTIYQLPFFGAGNLAAAALYAELVIAIASGFPTGGTPAVQRSAAEAIAAHYDVAA